MPIDLLDFLGLQREGTLRKIQIDKIVIVKSVSEVYRHRREDRTEIVIHAEFFQQLPVDGDRTGFPGFAVAAGGDIPEASEGSLAG